VSPFGVPAPPGYERLEVGDATVVTRTAAAAGMRQVLQEAPTVHAWAARAPDAEAFTGRATAWAATLPCGATRVVVRRSRHGGLLGPVRGERFVAPGRAPAELEIALRLQEAGVRTPDVVAYALYPAGSGFCRIDVITRRLPDGADLPALWGGADAPTREAILGAVASLLRDLQAAGAWHADLNAKNLHLARDGARWRAWVLDVDRVRFGAPNDAGIAGRNFARLARSLRKWRARAALPVDDATIARLAALAGVAA
jgi:Lipopolysaccharide kinase (Kdo/WaaP) family